MKIRIFCFLLMAFAVITGCSSDEEEELIGNWRSIGSFDGEARGDATGFVIGETAYICFGYNSKTNALKDLWSYSGQGWIPKARAILKDQEGNDSIVNTFPGVARYAAVSFSAKGRGYVGLGFDGKKPLKDFWEYDPQTDTWTEVKDRFPGIERYYAVGCAIGDVGYVGTGYDGGSNLMDFYSFTPGIEAGSGTWKTISSYQGSKRSGASVFVIGDCMYLLGGIANDGYPTDMQKYDQKTGQWEKDFLDLRNTDRTADDDKYDNIPRAYASTFVIDGKGYITLGQKSMALSSTYEFDPVGKIWIERTPFSRATRSYAVSFSFKDGNNGFVMTGRSSSSRFDDFFEFYPSSTNDTYDD
jgi:N-acetylneuraminic acid mutarotase